MARKNEPRKTVPAASLGPVDRMGDRARLTERALASAKAKSLKAAKAVPASEAAAAKVSTPSRKPAYVRAQSDFARMPAPPSGGAQVRRGRAFTAGSAADTAYAGIKPAVARPATQAVKTAVAVRRSPRLGTGVGGAIATAVAGAGLAAHDKLRSRKRKPAK